MEVGQQRTKDEQLHGMVSKKMDGRHGCENAKGGRTEDRVEPEEYAGC